MYGDLVRSILEKRFGAGKKSLVLGDIGEGGRLTYYYSFEEEKQIAAVRDLLKKKDLVDGIGKLPTLRRTLSDDFGDDERPSCVAFTQNEDYWYAEFYRIAGVTYSSSRGETAAKLTLDRYPFVTLTDREEDFYGFWRKMRLKKRGPVVERDGFAYWMNKALKVDPMFRAFAVDFFSAVAEAERVYILKDVGRAIENCGCFLLPVSYGELISFHTPAEAIRALVPSDAGLNVDLNKVDLNVGYVMSRLAAEIDRRDLGRVAKLGSADVAACASLPLLYDGFGVQEFLRCYYMNKFDVAKRSLNADYINDYLRMCAEAGEKYRIGFKLPALIRAHDELAVRLRSNVDEKELSLPLVCVPSKFDRLAKKIEKSGAVGFERITTTERLFEEGVYQHNCVFSRRDLVRSDVVSIYHWDHKGKSYTLQFAKDGKDFWLTEIKARFNEGVSEEHLADLVDAIGAFCFVDEYFTSGLPRPERFNGNHPRFGADFVLDDHLPF